MKNPGKWKTAVWTLAAALAAGCGAPGIPEPPSLELARPVRDLKATRKGNEVRLTWSVPLETTDHHAFRHAGATQICRSLNPPMGECGRPIGEKPTPVMESSSRRRSRSRARLPEQAQAPQATFIDPLSPALGLPSPTRKLVYAVSVLNSYGRSAGLSNQVQVPAAPTLGAPAGLAARLSGEGITLTWDRVPAPEAQPGLVFRYRVYRRDVRNGKDSIRGELGLETWSPTLVDTGFEWERTYEYRVTIVTLIDQASGTAEVEGEDTPPVRIFAHDVFPPSTPEGLEAVSSGPGQKPFVDLVWNANIERDLSGYNVYRRERAGGFEKINADLVKTPAFRDPDVAAGRQYFYSVSAVDVRGNESPRSEEAQGSVPY
ncbi:MAG: fibronectin type III domain-containing protein [Acidobacteria bacterium]|nr:fibronectin type III domain-containing protein [Acidobacteriota bacterium]